MERNKMGFIKSNERGNRAVRQMFLLTLFTALLFLSIVPAAFSQGEVYSIDIEPVEPMVFEDFIINLGVRNTGDELTEYVLDVFVSKDGQVKYENHFTFQLHPNKGIIFSPTFMPISVGKYKIVTKLYDKYKAILYDTKIEEIDVVSDVGPFDLSLDVITRKVRPGYEIPLIVRMKNIGIKGTDIKIAVSINCFEQRDIYKDFFVFLKGSGEVDKSLTIPACNEEGSRDVTAKLILFDYVYAESLSQVFINHTYYDFYAEFPKLIKIRQGESKVFDVLVKNTAGITINNLRLMIEHIPLEWIIITPPTIISIKAGESAMFIVNISVPRDATIIEYPITMMIGSDETLVQKDSTLEVITAEVVGPEEPVLLIPKELRNKLIIVFVAGIAVVALIVAWRKSKGKRGRMYEKEKAEALGKVKDMIG